MKNKIINFYSEHKRTTVSVPIELWSYYLTYCELNNIDKPVDYLQSSFDIQGGEKVTSSCVRGLIYLHVVSPLLHGHVSIDLTEDDTESLIDLDVSH